MSGRDLTRRYNRQLQVKSDITILYARINSLSPPPPAYRGITSGFPRLLVCHYLSRKDDIGIETDGMQLLVITHTSLTAVGKELRHQGDGEEDVFMHDEYWRHHARQIVRET